MRGPRMRVTLGLVTAMILGVLCQAALVHPTAAQQPGASAELRRVVGRVEILRKGQTQWLPAVAGARLVEGDDIRTFPGASAGLLFPDASTVVLIENSRLQMVKLEFDQQQQSRLVLLHLAMGKLRAVIAQTAITLVRARQSNFAISTPTAVAAARGTIVWMFTDGKTTVVAVEREPGNPGSIEFIARGTGASMLVLAGTMTTDANPPVLIPVQFLTISNPATAGANLDGSMGAPSVTTYMNLLSLSPAGSQLQGVSFSTSSGTQTSIGWGPTSLGVNKEVFVVCASPPCNP